VSAAQAIASPRRARAVGVLDWAGELALLGGRAARVLLRRPPRPGEVLQQIHAIGTRSLSVVLLTAIFSSLVLVVQTGVQLARFGAKEHVGNVVALSLVRELGPVLTALMVGGRVGAGITAELGSMSVTEQIDAMRSMGADPVRRLVLPRVLAGVICLPLLTALADLLGIAAAIVAGTMQTGVSLVYFYHSIIKVVGLEDVVGGLIKTVFFGFFITVIACHIGLRTRGGTEGVGRATTQTVVVTSIVTLVSDFFITKLLLGLGY
jgi:phospholipid/cholesterol/gamma-HCH transport system permease protein